jgi:hypothetical protein
MKKEIQFEKNRRERKIFMLNELNIKRINNFMIRLIKIIFKKGKVISIHIGQAGVQIGIDVGT